MCYQHNCCAQGDVKLLVCKTDCTLLRPSLIRHPYTGGKLSTPYDQVNDQVNDLKYGKKAGRRPGVAIAVTPLALFSKKRKHL